MRLHTEPRTDGFIDPQRLYTTEGLNTAVGLARESIREARNSGIVRPVKKGKQLYYIGAQVIQWLLTEEK